MGKEFHILIPRKEKKKSVLIYIRSHYSSLQAHALLLSQKPQEVQSGDWDLVIYLDCYGWSQYIKNKKNQTIKIKYVIPSKYGFQNFSCIVIYSTI